MILNRQAVKRRFLCIPAGGPTPREAAAPARPQRDRGNYTLVWTVMQACQVPDHDKRMNKQTVSKLNCSGTNIH